MINKNKLLSASLLVLFCFPFAHAVAKDNRAESQAQALMQDFFDSSNTPGLSISVGYDCRIAWSSGFGYNDLEQKVVVDPSHSRFRIGSVIKSMTAFAIAQLVDAGKLDLDAPVQTYVPEFPEKPYPISTRQLLGHLSGIRHYEGDEFFSRDYYETVTDGLVIFMHDPLKNKPGDAYLYSSYGYNLASAVIEGATGQDYLVYMTENVFEPLDMTTTSPDYLDQIIPGRGRYYYQQDGVTLNAPEVDNSYKWASGGYIGTSDDLVKFGLAQLCNSSISEKTRDMFWSRQTTNSGEETEYGLGWRITVDDNGHHWIGHGGGSVGGTTQFWIRPDDGLVIAMISNMSRFDFAEVLIALGDIFVPPVPAPVASE
jgi:CubicO group peptidase (beta-lactamase class C family)